LYAQKTLPYSNLNNYWNPLLNTHPNSKSSSIKVKSSKGKILADAETLESYQIQNNHTLIALCSTTYESKPTLNTTPPFIPPMNTGGQNPGNPLGVPMNIPNGSNPRNTMDNPMMNAMMNSVN
jgi:hypothetical protein